MGAFEYSAFDPTGRIKKGVMEGDTPRQVRQLLRERGLSPVSVEGIAERESKKRGLFRGKRISSTDLALITRQLATLIRSGTVLEEALRAVAEQSEKSRIKSVLASLRSKVLEGHTLAVAITDFPAIFPELYRATVDAGEQAGRLDVVFERLADYTEFRQHLRQKMQLALMYPIFLSVLAFLVVMLLLAYVVPQVVNVFENVGQELPLLTRALIATSGFLKHYGLVLVIAMVLAIIFWKFMLRKAGFRFNIHRALLKVPVVARFIKTLNAARFARSFSILTASGVSVIEGMRFSAQVIGNMAIRQAVEEAANRVREGESIHKTLRASGYFPPLTIHLIASGEASADLEGMMEKAAQAQEREIEAQISAAMAIFEPVLILVMGVVILGIVFAIMMPIMDLNQLVR